MDYIIGFIVGYLCKEIYTLLRYLSKSETTVIEYDLDEEWDWISRPEDLP